MIRGDIYILRIYRWVTRTSIFIIIQEAPPQSPVGHAQDFQAFLIFVRSKIVAFVTPSSAQAFFGRLFVDFQATHEGFHRLLQAIENGEIFNTTTDGSKLEIDEASAGWLFWILLYEDDEDYDAEKDTGTTNGRRQILLANTILVDGRLKSNTSYRAEGTGKLAAVIVLQCLYDFLGRTPTKPPYHTCDNQALVSRVNTIRKYNDFKTLNDPIDGDIVVPTAYWATATMLESKWVRGSC